MVAIFMLSIIVCRGSKCREEVQVDWQGSNNESKKVEELQADTETEVRNICQRRCEKLPSCSGFSYERPVDGPQTISKCLTFEKMPFDIEYDDGWNSVFCDTDMKIKERKKHDNSKDNLAKQGYYDVQIDDEGDQVKHGNEINNDADESQSTKSININRNYERLLSHEGDADSPDSRDNMNDKEGVSDKEEGKTAHKNIKAHYKDERIKYKHKENLSNREKERMNNNHVNPNNNHDEDEDDSMEDNYKGLYDDDEPDYD